MENVAAKQLNERGESKKNTGPLIIFIVTIVLVAVALWQFSTGTSEQRPVDSSELLTIAQGEKISATKHSEEVINDSIELSPDVVADVIEELVVTVKAPDIEQVIALPLPPLDESDAWLQGRLPELTWRNELLSLLITEDIIRRFVVFTDNFAQGLLAYEYSPFIPPKVKFAVDEQSSNIDGEKNVWQWDSATSKRFDIYVDLLRSIDSTTLVQWYVDLKPLINEAYSELGYEDDFTYTLQDAINRVLDMELPKSTMNVTRTSVMYKYHDPQLEALDDSDKLLLRIGKENLLIIKSVLLEVNEKLAK
ncbi:hypothetical protein CMT41_13040 [Colwellia sp. MT41]|uniref:DUF3014 domain-containing protein n=1 Tax=Colwellia sp. MT41 TaxID=58049 RepID=UPI00071755FE|nr:DUF3014 domain-containing protein [Colwellia sp. MT41]ALO35536.1 hypothetical protein CMT41_13040 [Colwellia sp. MT41]